MPRTDDWRDDVNDVDLIASQDFGFTCNISTFSHLFVFVVVLKEGKDFSWWTWELWSSFDLPNWKTKKRTWWTLAAPPAAMWCRRWLQNSQTSTHFGSNVHRQILKISYILVHKIIQTLFSGTFQGFDHALPTVFGPFVNAFSAGHHFSSHDNYIFRHDGYHKVNKTEPTEVAAFVCFEPQQIQEQRHKSSSYL